MIRIMRLEVGGLSYHPSWDVLTAPYWTDERSQKLWYKCPPCVLLQVPKAQPVALITSPEDSQHYEEARQCVEELALYLKPLSNTRGTNPHVTHLALDALIGGRF